MMMPFWLDALDEQVGVDVEQRPVAGRSLAQTHLLDDHGDRVRQLVADALERGLADQLGDQRLLRLVGELALGVERLALGQQRRPAGRASSVDLVAATRRTPGRSRPSSTPACSPSRVMPIRCWASRSGVDEVGLGGDRPPSALAHLGQLRHQVAVAGPDRVAGGQADADDVDLGPGRLDQVVQPLAQQRARLVQARGVDQDQLAVGAVDDAAHGVTGGLRPGRRDRDLLADQRVGQGRLARVGPADQADEPAAVRRFAHVVTDVERRPRPGRPGRSATPVPPSSRTTARSGSSTASASVTSDGGLEPAHTAAGRHRDRDLQRGQLERRQVDRRRGVRAAVGVADRRTLEALGARAAGARQGDELRVLGIGQLNRAMPRA